MNCESLPVSYYRLLQSVQSRHYQTPILTGSCLVLFEGFTMLPGLVSNQQTQVCPVLYPIPSSTVGTTGKCFFSILLPGVTGMQPSKVNNCCGLCAGNLVKGTCCKPCDLWPMTQVLVLAKHSIVQLYKELQNGLVLLYPPYSIQKVTFLINRV